MDGVDGEGIRRADGSADVGVVVEVLDRDVHFVSPSVDISNDRFARPVPVCVDDIATVAIAEQLRVITAHHGDTDPARDRCQWRLGCPTRWLRVPESVTASSPEPSHKGLMALREMVGMR